jgi:ethanolamine ammonia-lyase small subunit
MNDDSQSIPAPAGEHEKLWTTFRRFTPARIGLKRSGSALATEPLLDIRMAHARARDAVHASLDEGLLLSQLAASGLPTLTVSSAAHDRQSYLMRPDLGRRLDPSARAHLAVHASNAHDVVFVVTGGLSACAVQLHAPPLLTAIVPTLRAENLHIAPLVVVRQGRVAIGDAIAEALRASIVVILIGERPGLSSPDSMGAYLTWRPTPHTTDAERNCISNIRPEGIPYADAAFRLTYMLREMRRRQISGVPLKDESDSLRIGTPEQSHGGRG